MGIKMIKISVCDDDEGQLTFFKQCFMEYNEKHKEKIEANFYQSVQSLLNEKKFSPDVYFLDIELQDGNGLKLAGKNQDKKFQDTDCIYNKSRRIYAGGISGACVSLSE
ncbi:MAG: hypothetical protein V8S35_06420 [Lachnospira sp.]